MPKKLLVIDDSALMRRILSDIIESDERFLMEDSAVNGVQALDLVVASPQKYDIAILDINMPKMNGIEFLEHISKIEVSMKVIVVSTVAKEGAVETIRCLELGAFDFVTKPDSFIEAKTDRFRLKILAALAAAAGFQPVEQPVEQLVQGETKPSETKTPVMRPRAVVGLGGKKLVALACSTGGPKALHEVIPRLPENLNAPVLIVQHMPEGFTASLAARLDETSKIAVKEATDKEVIQKGTVYIAKGGHQMRLRQFGGRSELSVRLEAARNGLKPCADILYESLTEMEFDEVICVVLTGMGGDGTAGIRALSGAKNVYVIAQDEQTSTVYGMPKVIAESGLTNEIVPIEKVAEAITKNVGVY